MKVRLLTLTQFALILPTFLFAQEQPTGAITEPEKGHSYCFGFYDQYPPIYSSALHHFVVQVIDSGSSLSLGLEDGSVWKIAPSDHVKALNWKTDEPVLIIPNLGFFGGRNTYYPYLLRKKNGISVEAKLTGGPIAGGTYTRYINGAIDYTRGLIDLTDTTRWEVYPADLPILAKWKSGDCIIFGFNNKGCCCRSDSDFENILINIYTAPHDENGKQTEQQYVRARQF